MNEVRKVLVLIVACTVITELHAEPIATHTGARNPLS